MKITKVGAEWCAFADNGREVARSHSKELLQAYLNDVTHTTNEEDDMPAIAKISYRTRARSTGAATASGRTADKSWAAMCVSHGMVVPADSGTAAEKLTSKPQEWCTTCASIAAGELPKVAKNPELDELL